MRRRALLLAAFSLAVAAVPLGGAAATTTVTPLGGIRPLATTVLPFDFDADGFAETVVGVPGEDIGSGASKIANAGVLDVIPGSASGPDYANTVQWSQGADGLAGEAEANDYFGLTQASGDFNGDGYADLAIGTPNEDLAGNQDAGNVTAIYGSATGLTSVASTAQTFAWGGGEGELMGSALAVGDFDNDGKDDLVVSVGGGQYVLVVYGDADGLQVYNTDQFDEAELPGKRSRDSFGFSLATGDVTGDGVDDLAVGDPYDYETHGYSTGAVTLIKSSGRGLTGSGAQRFTVDSPGIKGVAHKYTGKGDDQVCDCLGYQVALGDVNGDGFADLLASAPGTPVTRAGKAREDAGELHMIPGSPTGLTDVGDLLINEESAEIPGKAAVGDHIGNTLAVSDMDGDGDADAAMALGSQEAVMILAGGATFGQAGSKWSQNSGGVPGGLEAEDDFGDWLRFAAIKGAGGPQQLLVGTPGENGVGAVWLFDAASENLSSTGVLSFDQDTTGIPGATENNDWFGFL